MGVKDVLKHDYSEADNEIIRVRWLDGHSASDIAGELGRLHKKQISRNAIIGKVFRWKLVRSDAACLRASITGKAKVAAKATGWRKPKPSTTGLQAKATEALKRKSRFRAVLAAAERTIVAEAQRPRLMAPGGSAPPQPKVREQYRRPDQVGGGVGLDIVDLGDGMCKRVLGYFGDVARYCGAPCVERRGVMPGRYRWESYCSGCSRDLGVVVKPLRETLSIRDRKALSQLIKYG